MDRMGECARTETTAPAAGVRDRAQRPAEPSVGNGRAGEKNVFQKYDNAFAEWRAMMPHSRRNSSTTKTTRGVTAFPRGRIALETREIADGNAVNSRPKSILGDFPGIYARNQNRFLRSWSLGIQGLSDTQVPFRVEVASIQLLLRKAPGTRLHPTTRRWKRRRRACSSTSKCSTTDRDDTHRWGTSPRRSSNVPNILNCAPVFRGELQIDGTSEGFG